MKEIVAPILSGQPARFAQTYYALRLRLNPGEDDHRRLLDTWRRLSNSQRERRRDAQTMSQLSSDAGARVAQIV